MNSAGDPSGPPWRDCSLFGLWLVLFDRWVAGVSAFIGTLRARLILRLLRCDCGRGLHVDGRLLIRCVRPGGIGLGDHVRIVSRYGSNVVGLTNGTILHCSRTGRIRIGDHSGLSAAILSSRSSITLGRHVNVGGNARIYDHDFHSLDHRIRRDPDREADSIKSAPVVVGDDVFIGTNAIILKGVTIGAGAIIGAGAVVALPSVPAGAVVAGNPARIVRLGASPRRAGGEKKRGRARPSRGSSKRSKS